MVAQTTTRSLEGESCVETAICEMVVDQARFGRPSRDAALRARMSSVQAREATRAKQRERALRQKAAGARKGKQRKQQQQQQLSGRSVASSAASEEESAGPSSQRRHRPRTPRLGGSRVAFERHAMVAAVEVEAAAEEAVERQAKVVQRLDEWLALAPQRQADADAKEVAKSLAKRLSLADALAKGEERLAKDAEAREALHSAALKLRTLEHEWAVAGVAMLEAEREFCHRELAVLASILKQWHKRTKKDLGRRPTAEECAADAAYQKVLGRREESAARLKKLERRLARAVYKEVAWPAQHWGRQGKAVT